MQQLLSSDLVLVVISLILGGLIGMFAERARLDRNGNSVGPDRKQP
ncbi:MAG: hypothetical protein RIS17_1719 [Pseudomonadota bacterium]|jgi:hypothetical protein